MLNKSQKINELLCRGVEKVIIQKNLAKRLKKGEVLRVKHGVDPTGPKIHLGRATQFWKLKAFQELGHKIILIIGDFTAQIGDASDKQSKRQILTPEQIEENMKNYLPQIGKILDLEKVETHHNSEWLSKLSAQKLLNLAMHFTAQQMIQRHNFKDRWEQNKPIGLHETYYPLLQAYDSVAVKADLELGGSDQLFNLKIGRKMQEFFGQKPQEIMTLKMLNGLDDRKMSTSWGNVINITDSPQEMFGKIMSMKDEMIFEYFELCTQIDVEELKAIQESLQENTVNPRDLKAKLGRILVETYYNEKASLEAEKEFGLIFQQGKVPTKIPVYKTKEKKYNILDLLMQTKLAQSKSAGKRLIQQKGIRINEEVLQNWQEYVILKNNDILQVGKRKFIQIIIQ